MELFSILTKKTHSMVIGSRIKEGREALGMSQKELAETIGIDASQFSKIERGKVMPTMLQMIEIAKTLSQSLDWFVKNEMIIENPKIVSEVNFKEQYEWAKQKIELLHTIQELKDKNHLLEIENNNLQNKRRPTQETYPMVAEPVPELSKKK